MAIIQIAKQQQRTGNLVDLPQLDEGELGWATDAKKLYIGKITPNENIEILTSYSTIDFNQLNGAVGNLNVNESVSDGQVLAYDGSNWTNRGGDAGGLIALGDVSNVRITGGAIGYVLETDGLGNLSWAPKTSLVFFIQNITNANPGVVTTTTDHLFANGARITVTDVQGMTELNGGTYFVDVLSSNSFALYTDADLINPLNTTGFGDFPFSILTETNAVSDRITVADETAFTINMPVIFGGDIESTITGIVPGRVYFVASTGIGFITIKETVTGSTLNIGTATGLNGFVYAANGRVLSSISGSGIAVAGGANTSIQYNNAGQLAGGPNFRWDFANSVMTVIGNANIGNITTTGLVTSPRFVSTVATGVAAPFTVNSTDRVANLNVAHANVSDFGNVTQLSTGTVFPTFVNNSATGNRALIANGSVSYDIANSRLTVPAVSSNTANIANMTVTGTLNIIGSIAGNISGGNTISANLLGGTLTTAAQPNITSVGTLTNLTVSGTTTSTLFSGSGANLTNLNASNLTTGTVPAARLSGTYTITVNGSATSATTAGTVTTAAQPNITSVGTLTGLTVSGNLSAGNAIATSVQTGNLTTGATATPGSITGNWTLTSGSRLQATYADLAEFYLADQPYQPGTVLEFGGDEEVTLASADTPRVAGVVSTDPAYIMNAGLEGEKVAIALQGRVPCKVVGEVRKGDMLVSAGEGYAKASANPMIGTVIGKALEDFTCIKGVIEVAVGRL